MTILFVQFNTFAFFDGAFANILKLDYDSKTFVSLDDKIFLEHNNLTKAQNFVRNISVRDTFVVRIKKFSDNAKSLDRQRGKLEGFLLF